VTADNPFATLYAFPNPAKNELHIGIPDAISASNIRVRITDMQGKEMKDCRVERRDNRLTLDISLLPAGNYVISFPELDGEASIKFQKN
jgi:methionine-rich copper-binding protein CopC